MPSGRRVTNMRRAGHLARAERHAHKGLVRQVRQVKQDARRDMRCGCRHVGQRLGCGLAWSIAVAADGMRQIEEAAGLKPSADVSGVRAVSGAAHPRLSGRGERMRSAAAAASHTAWSSRQLCHPPCALHLHRSPRAAFLARCDMVTVNSFTALRPSLTPCEVHERTADRVLFEQPEERRLNHRHAHSAPRHPHE